MKLVQRLTLYFLVAIGVVFAVDAYLSVRQHLRLFEADLRRDERLLGRALGHAVEKAWRDHGEEYAVSLVNGANDRESHVRIRLISLDAAPGAREAPDVPGEALSAFRHERTISQVRREEPEARLYSYVPLAIAGERRVALELSESLAHEQEYLAARIRHKFSTALLLVLASGLVAWGVGLRVVGRPIHALVEKARRIGAGDFSGPLILRPRDEFSQLADEMNVMAEHLESAACKISAESAARVTALEQLRHAERLSTVGKLASGLAHELGTPLNVVSGRARMILSGEAARAEEVEVAARIILEQTERITQLVRQLLDFARARRLDRRSLAVEPIVRETTQLLEPLAAQRGVELRFEEAASCTARIDRNQIQQAFANVVVNGIQAAARGGHVRIRLEEYERPPDTAAQRLRRCAVVEVQDDGEGIPPDRLPAIFDPFFTTKPVGEGTGLGLSVAHGIVREHGGFIEVRSEPGRGSCFRLWLPCEVEGDGPGPDRR